MLAFFLCGIVLAFQLLKRSLRNMILSGMPRPQQFAFVIRLRDLVFSDPHRFMMMLFSEEKNWFVRGLWRECGAKAKRISDAGGSPEEGISVSQMQLRDGRALAVVKMPERVEEHETMFVGIVLPRDETLARDITRARQQVRFFYLNRYGGPDRSRTTDLCGWTIKKQLRTYNVGAPPTEQGFAEAIEKKLVELRQ